MVSENEEIVQSPVPHAVEEEYFDPDRFITTECERNYDKLMSKSIINKRGIHLDKLEVKMPDFFRRLTGSGWSSFSWISYS